MSRKSDCTIFLVTESEVVRADFASQKLLNLVRTGREPLDSAAEVIKQLAAAKPRIGRRCLVFETSVWSQVVSVPKRSIDDIEPEELQNALKFEVETLSGVDAERSALGIAELTSDDPSQASFWINVVNSDQFEAISEIAKSRGARSVGLAHPAGFVSDQLVKGRVSQTVELWENIAVLMERNFPKNIVGRTGRWLEQFGIDPSDPKLLVLAQSGELTGDDAVSVPIQTLDDESTLNAWLQSAAKRGMSDSVNSFPLVKKFEQVVSVSTISRTFYRVAAAVLVGLFCLWHWNWLDAGQKRVDLEIAQLEKPAADKRNFDQQLASVLEQRSKLEQDANATQLKIKKIEFLMEFQRGRLGELLEHVKTLRTVDMVINKIELDGQGLVVSGLSLSSNSAPELAKQLTTVAKPMGWNVKPASQAGRNQLKDGGPYEFSILLQDVGPGKPITGSDKSDKVTRVNAT